MGKSLGISGGVSGDEAESQLDTKLKMWEINGIGCLGGKGQVN